MHSIGARGHNEDAMQTTVTTEPGFNAIHSVSTQRCMYIIHNCLVEDR